jgi:hypothetical protein
MSGRWPALALSFWLASVGGCGAPHRPSSRLQPRSGAALPFRDVAQESGVRFTHYRGESGRHHMPETMGSGCLFFDYDGDGWPDIYLLQGAALPGASPPASTPCGQLFRNDRHGRFQEVPNAGGLDPKDYGLGGCAADIDNDGDLDVALTTLHGCKLFRNDHGRFTDVTKASGLATSGWAASAAFGDYDGDGLIDLFVTDYVDYTPGVSRSCTTPDGSPSYCPPEVYPATRDHLYRNLGGGRFVDVSQASGITAVATRGLGVLWTDYDGDGKPDIYVACDQSPNVLWHNLGGGRFENVAVTLACAYDPNGEILNGMGVDAADFDHDGDQDLFVTNFSGQPNSLYENLGRRGFRFVSGPSGLGLPSVRLLGFGCNFLDYDRDGWEDVFVVNGHVNDHIAKIVPDLSYPQPCSLYRNLTGARFAEVPSTGAGIWRSRVSRGSAVADYDRDGAPDLLVSNNGGPAELFHNELKSGNHWLAVSLEGVRSNRSAVGARIRVVTTTTQTREVRAGSSYLSQSDLTQTFGLGSATVSRLEVRWPSGRQTVLSNVTGDRLLKVREP